MMEPQIMTSFGAYQLDGSTIDGEPVQEFVEDLASADFVVTTIPASGAMQAVSSGLTSEATTTVFDITLSAACTISIAGGVTGYFQRLTLILRQPASTASTGRALAEVRTLSTSPLALIGCATSLRRPSLSRAVS